MKALLRGLIGISLTCIFTSSCNVYLKMEDENSAPRQTEEMAGLVETAVYQTAVFETEVALQLTDLAPTATTTGTPSPTFTITQEPSSTPTITETVVKDPWVLQDRCLTENPSPCVTYRVTSTIVDTWLFISLVDQKTGQTGEFSVPPKSQRFITLMPGEYKSTYAATCDGVHRVVTRIWNLSEKSHEFYCSTGLDELRFRVR